MIKYITTHQAAEKRGVSVRRLQQYLAAGRIKGAFQHGDSPNAPWLIPADFVMRQLKRGPKTKDS